MVTLVTEQHMEGWVTCLAEWEESHLNWDLGKKEVMQWYDPRTRFFGARRIIKNLMEVPRRFHVCHKEIRADKPRMRQMKTQFWDELLMGNVWTHYEPVLAEVKEARIAYKAQNYAKAGKHFGQTLFKLTGGVVPIENISTNDMNGIFIPPIPPHPPIPHPDITVPPVVLEASELVAGLFYGLTGK